MKTEDGWNREPPEPGSRVLLIRRFPPDGEGVRGIAYHNSARWVFRWDDEDDGYYEQSWWPKEGIGWAFAEDCGPKPEEKAEAPSLKPSQWVKAQGHGWTLLVEGAPVVHLVPLDEFWKLKTVGNWRALVAPYGSWAGCIGQAQLWGKERGAQVPPLAEPQPEEPKQPPTLDDVPPTLDDVAAALNACAAVLNACAAVNYTTIFDSGYAEVTLSAEGIPALQAAGAVWSGWYDRETGGQQRHLKAEVDGVSFTIFESRVTP